MERKEDPYLIAVRNGDLDELKALKSSNYYTMFYLCGSFLCSVAAQNGYLEVLKWLVENDFVCGGDTFVAAARGGNIHILEWLKNIKHRNVNKMSPSYNSSLYEAAASAGNLHILRWLTINDFPKSGYGPFNGAARSGNIKVLEWLKENDFSWHNTTCVEAAGEGHLDALCWLIKEGCPYNIELCYLSAILNKHTRVVEWIENEYINKNSAL